MSRDARALVVAMLGAARAAADVVMRIYGEGNFRVEFKEGDDPVTRADKEANALLLEHLGRVLPGVTIVAEESEPSTFAEYTRADAAFFVDPLDGTREFVSRNGEFCVMVGFAEAGAATLGAVVCPAAGRSFIGASGLFAEEISPSGARSPVRVSSAATLEESRVLISRSHKSEATDRILARLGARALVPFGSAGMKSVQIASGDFDIYVHPGPSGMLWDSCAPEAIVRGAGGLLTDAVGRAIDYRRSTLQNTGGVLAASPRLHGLALAALGSWP